MTTTPMTTIQSEDATRNHDAIRKNYAEKILPHAGREPQSFLQLDGVYWPEGDDYFHTPDDDGDCLKAGNTVELMQGVTVRVLVPQGVEVQMAIRQLKKLTKWLTKYPQLMFLSNPPHIGGGDFTNDAGMPFN